jgi:hypothetical protein
MNPVQIIQYYLTHNDSPQQIIHTAVLHTLLLVTKTLRSVVFRDVDIEKSVATDRV